ncbi:MAG: hypothetical protein ACPLXC_02255 [Candidatus Pacearchaeota archaeon]
MREKFMEKLFDGLEIYINKIVVKYFHLTDKEEKAIVSTFLKNPELISKIKINPYWFYYEESFYIARYIKRSLENSDGKKILENLLSSYDEYENKVEEKKREQEEYIRGLIKKGYSKEDAEREAFLLEFYEFTAFPPIPGVYKENILSILEAPSLDEQKVYRMCKKLQLKAKIRRKIVELKRLFYCKYLRLPEFHKLIFCSFLEKSIDDKNP